jgi:hypothetical protein
MEPRKSGIFDVPTGDDAFLARAGRIVVEKALQPV